MPFEFSCSEVRAYYSCFIPAIARSRALKWRGPCPIHSGKRPNLAVNLQTGRWFCFSKCGRGGDMITFEIAMRGGTFRDARDRVFSAAGRVVPLVGPPQAPIHDPRLVEESLHWANELARQIQRDREVESESMGNSVSARDHCECGEMIANHSRTLNWLSSLSVTDRMAAYIAALAHDPERVAGLVRDGLQNDDEARHFTVLIVRLIEEAEAQRLRKSA
jgi:hypothetical protein